MSKEEELKKLKEFVKERKIKYSIAVAEDYTNNNAYFVWGIPHLVMIDRKGVVKFYKVGSGSPELIEKLVKKLIEEE